MDVSTTRSDPGALLQNAILLLSLSVILLPLSSDALLPNGHRCFSKDAKVVVVARRRLMAMSKYIENDGQKSPTKNLMDNQSSSLSSSLEPLAQPSPRHGNKAMQFLRKIGRVGGEMVDFTNAIGVDEGSSTKTAGKWSSSGGGAMPHFVMKSKDAFRSCIESGTIDDMSERFPVTSSGTQWRGITDRVMGGLSSATLSREDLLGRSCNVLRADVKLLNNDGGGFVQMATDLALDPAVSDVVDASAYQGIEMEILYTGEDNTESFNVHLKNTNCVQPSSSYRATFQIDHGEWTTIRLLWPKFQGYGPRASDIRLDVSSLRRIAIVAIGKAMDVTLALSSIRFV